MNQNYSNLGSVAVAVLSLITIGGCGGTEVELLDAQNMMTQEIRNGVVTQERPEVGKVTSNFSLCTGTLIAPDLVLTAAHCVAGETPRTIHFEPGTRGALQYEVRDLRFTSGFTRVGLPDTPDLALLHLLNPIPGIPTASLANQVPPIGSVVDVYGYGRDESNGNAGTKRKGRMLVSEYYSGTARLPNGASYTAKDVEFLPAGNNELTCPGDSGGPVMNTQGQIIGVNSYVRYADSARQTCADFVSAGAASVPYSLALLDAWRQELTGTGPGTSPTPPAPGPGPAPAPAPAPGTCQNPNARFQNAPTGCQDKKTGRIWSSRLPARKQQNAKESCLNLEEAGVSDWRLPTKKELTDLAANQGAKSLKGVGSQFYWSKSKQSGKGIVVKVRNKKMKKLSPNQKQPLYCVRN